MKHLKCKALKIKPNSIRTCISTVLGFEKQQLKVFCKDLVSMILFSCPVLYDEAEPQDLPVLSTNASKLLISKKQVKKIAAYL